MRLSTYAIFLPLFDDAGKEIQGQELLINGLYGAMDIVETETANKLRAGDFAKIGLSNVEKFIWRGHITRKEIADEIEDVKLLGHIYRKLFGRRKLSPTIMPTYDCNFRCPYCFEQHRLAKGREWLETTMSSETVNAVFSSLKDYQARGRSFEDCILYGGEPFLAKNLPVIREIAGRAKEMGMNIRVVSNGYELDAFLDFCKEFGVKNIQLTLDGVGEVNNRRRIHKSGCGSYERILENMELALECGVDVRLRVNVGRENLHGIKDLIDDLKARGFLEKEEKRAAEEKARELSENKQFHGARGEFYYYFKATNDDAHPKNDLRERDILNELIKIGLNMESAMYHIAPYWGAIDLIGETMEKTGYPSFSPCHCGAENAMPVIDPFGDLYACWDMVGREELAVGFTDSLGRFMWNLDKAKWNTRTADLMEKCRICPYVFICRGGCASRALNAHGDSFREFCGESKEIFSLAASYMAGKAWSKTPERELTLSLAGPLSRLTESERQSVMETSNQKVILEILQRASFMSEAISNEND